MAKGAQCCCLVALPVGMLVASVVSSSFWSHGPEPARLFCPYDSLGKNTGVGSHDFRQGIFPTQGSNSCLFMSPALAGGFFISCATWEVWFLWAPVNRGTQVCTLGMWAETQPHSLSHPFSTALSTHLSSTDFNISPPYLPLQALGVTQLWSSAPLARFPRMSRRAQARSWGESQRHLVLHYLRPFNLCLRMETTWGSRDRHLISALPDLRNLCYFVPKSLNWAKWMESSFHDCTLYLTQLIPELCTQQSQQKPSLVTFT